MQREHLEGLLNLDADLVVMAVGYIMLAIDSDVTAPVR